MQRGETNFSFNDHISCIYRTDMIGVFHFYMIFYFIRFNWTKINFEFDLNELFSDFSILTVSISTFIPSYSLSNFSFAGSSIWHCLYYISMELSSLLKLPFLIQYGLFINWCIPLIFCPKSFQAQIDPTPPFVIFWCVGFSSMKLYNVLFKKSDMEFKKPFEKWHHSENWNCIRKRTFCRKLLWNRKYFLVYNEQVSKPSKPSLFRVISCFLTLFSKIVVFS